MNKIFEDINTIVIEDQKIDIPLAITKNYMNVNYFEIHRELGLNIFYIDNGLSLGLNGFNRFSKAEFIGEKVEIEIIKDEHLSAILGSYLLILLKDNSQWLDSSILTKDEKDKIKEVLSNA